VSKILNQRADNILIRTPNWLGDLMMSTAFIRSVLDAYPQSKIDLIVKSGFENLPLPCRGNIQPFDKNVISAYQFGKKLRKQAYDTVFVLPPSFSSALMAFAAQIPRRIGYGENFRSFLLKPAVKYANKPRSQHLIDEYLGLIPSAKNQQIIYPELAITDKWIESQLSDIDRLPDSFVTLAPGAIFGPAKQWPADHYGKLASLIAQENGAVVVVGTMADHALGEQISESVENVTNLCGKTSLNQLVAILARSNVLVSNDSGAMHIMAALKRPQIAIFGSTSAVWTSPRNLQSEIFRLDMDCSPCFKRTCRFGHYHCLEHIQPTQVMVSIEGLLRINEGSKS